MPAVDRRFKKGLELFNEGKFFECHDVIESLWLETPSTDPYRDFYKGVIQAAAALYQLKRGISSGALGLFKTSIRYLSAYTPVALGLDTQKLITDLEKCFAGHPLEFDPLLAPKLKYLKRMAK